jgi:hypothetical protein
MLQHEREWSPKIKACQLVVFHVHGIVLTLEDPANAIQLRWKYIYKLC